MDLPHITKLASRHHSGSWASVVGKVGVPLPPAWFPRYVNVAHASSVGAHPAREARQGLVGTSVVVDREIGSPVVGVEREPPAAVDAGAGPEGRDSLVAGTAVLDS